MIWRKLFITAELIKLWAIPCGCLYEFYTTLIQQRFNFSAQA
jgi:hypothetical protein